MHSILLQVGGLTLYWYGLFMALAFLAGLVHWTRLARFDGRPPQFCPDLLFWVMVGGLVGARATYVVANAADYAERPLRVLFLWEGGLIFYGGFAGGLAAVVAFARRHRLSTLALLDFTATALPLAHALGRVGCFMNGCCFGAPSGLPWAVSFPAQTLPWARQVDLGLIDAGHPRSLPVHPVQLYETLLNLALYVLLLLLYRRRPRPGMVAALYLLTYPFGRFALECLRGTDRLHVGILSMAQSLSLWLLVAGLVLLLVARRQPVPVPPAPAP